MDKKTEALKLALEALEIERNVPRLGPVPTKTSKAITALREALASEAKEQPAQQEPVAWADECRISLVTAIHFLASDYENALSVFRDDTEARRKAEGDIAYARKIAAKWNWNGTSPQAQRTWVGLTEKEMNDITCGMVKSWVMDELARTIEAKLREKNT